eukprot:PhF_6_TR27124/c0_g1_i1/m.39542
MLQLIEAARDGQTELLSKLIETGLNPTVKDSFGSNPLHYAASNGHLDAVELLLTKGCPALVVNKIGCTPFHNACSNGHVSVVRRLLRESIAPTMYINMYEMNGELPIHEAAAHGHVEIVNILIENKADIHAPTQSENQNTALHEGARKGHVSILETLLRAGAHVNGRNAKGTQPLHMAAYSGHSECVRVLLENGADVHACVNTGETALNLAALGNHVDVVNTLLEHGSLPSECKDIDEIFHKTTLAIQAIFLKATASKLSVTEGGDEQLYAQTVQHIPMKAKDLRYSFGSEHLNKRVGPHHNTCLYYACFLGYHDTVKELLGAGAVIHVEGVSTTPLSIAAMCGHAEIAYTLLQAGAMDAHAVLSNTMISPPLSEAVRNVLLQPPQVDVKLASLANVMEAEDQLEELRQEILSLRVELEAKKQEHSDALKDLVLQKQRYTEAKEDDRKEITKLLHENVTLRLQLEESNRSLTESRKDLEDKDRQIQKLLLTQNTVAVPPPTNVETNSGGGSGPTLEFEAMQKRYTALLEENATLWEEYEKLRQSNPAVATITTSPQGILRELTAIDITLGEVIYSQNFSCILSCTVLGQPTKQFVAKRPNAFHADNKSISFDEMKDVAARSFIEINVVNALPPHPNVVHPIGVLYNTLTRQGNSLIVPQLLVYPKFLGGDVKTLAVSSTIPFERGVQIIRDAARGLKHMHMSHIIHRDVTSMNILLEGPGGTGRAAISDLGEARMEGLEENGIVSGTSPHGDDDDGDLDSPSSQYYTRRVGAEYAMAPEVRHHGMRSSKSSDLWGIGVVALELLDAGDTNRKTNRLFPCYVRGMVGVTKQGEVDALLDKIKKVLTDCVAGGKSAEAKELWGYVTCTLKVDPKARKLPVN